VGQKTCPHFGRENVRGGQILTPNQIVAKILACQNFGMPKFWYQSKQAPNTRRHLCEYIGLHVEMEIKEHYFEVIKKNLCLFAIAAVQKLIGFSCL